MTTDTQIQWDQDVARHTRQMLRQLAGKVRDAQEKEHERKEEARAARQAARQAHEELTGAIEAESDEDDLHYVRHVGALTAAAEQAREDETAARQRWVAAVVRRRKAQDELRAAARRHMAPLPLFDRPAETNGHSEELTASAPVETARVPADEVQDARQASAIYSGDDYCQDCAGTGKEWGKDGAIRDTQGKIIDRKTCATCKGTGQEPKPDPMQAPGRRLDAVPLAGVLKDPEHVAYLAQRGCNTLGDLADLANREKQPLDEILEEHFAMRKGDSINVMFAAMDWLMANPPPAPKCTRRCKGCGCIDAECARCIILKGQPCQWATEDLCTACHDSSWRVLSIADLELPKRIQKQLLAQGLGSLSGPGTLGQLADRLDELSLDEADRMQLRDMIRQAAGEPLPEESTEVDAKSHLPQPAADPLAAPCPKCRAAAGEKCKNYRGQNCAPHRQRGKPAEEKEPESKEEVGLFTASSQPLEGISVLNGQAGTNNEDGWPLPTSVTPEALEKSYIVDRFYTPKGREPKPATVYPIEVGGQLWVCWGYAGSHPGRAWMMLPLCDKKNFIERYPGYLLRVQPNKSARRHEDRIQMYTGVIVKVNRKEMAIAPAGEGKTFIRAKE